VALRIIPRGDRRATEPLDLPGGLLLALTVAGALLAATEASRGNPGAPIVIAASGLALAGCVGLIVRQRLAVAPFIPRDLLSNGRFVALSALSLMAMGANLPILIAVPLLLTGVNRLSPVHIGLALLPEAIVFTLLGPVAGRVVDRVGPRIPIRSGLLAMFVALASLSTFGAGASAWVVSVLVALLSAGFAFVNAPLTTTISLLVPPVRLASGLSMNSMLFFLGGAFGTALISAVLTARAAARNALNPVYGGPAVAFSDAFLVQLALLVVAFALTLALPARGYQAPEQLEPEPRPAEHVGHG
jgi:MFS family permease